jgi:hypothetical protein
LAPTQTSEARSQSMSTVSTNVSGSQRDSSFVKRTTATAAMPACSNAESFCSSVIRRGGAFSGLSTFGGCGSKIIATAVPVRSSAWRRTSSSSLRWPRWTPSKFPSPTTG